MKVLLLATLFTAVTAPVAMAVESEIDCQTDDVRRAATSERLDPAPVSPPTTARPTVATREAADAPRPAPPERRRNGKRVPDAELISPRGVL